MKSINKNRIGLVLLIVAGFGAAVLTTTGQSPTHTAGRGMSFTSQATPSVTQLPASNAKHKTSTHTKLAVKLATHHVVDSLSQSTPQVKRVMILSTQKAGIIGKYDGHQFDNPADNVFSILLERQPAPTDKVFLSYQLTGLSHYSGVSCSINDRLAMGGYLAKKSPETTLQRIQLNAQWLTQGDNRIQFSLPADADYGCKISDLSLEVEPSTATSPLVINAPAVLLNGKAYLHGFLTGQLANTASSIAIDGTIVKVHDGEFETIVSTKAQFPLSITAQGEGGTAYSTTVQFATNDEADHEYQLQKPGASLSQHFNVGQAASLGADNVLLKLTEQALKSTQPLSVTALRDVDLPALDMGMNNVTAGNQGYRFLPHGEHFNAGATVALKYDRTKIPTGYTENDVRTYYFDNETHHWVPLERDTVDKSLCMVVSKTTHFTDMINGIIKVPESPQTEGFAPTMMNDIKIADPASKIQVIAPPAPNNTGSANLNYHIEVPPARNGMAPDLNISYSSDGGSGWLGEGWNLNVSSITVDTRWGVPRYDKTYETETYTLDGEMLATHFVLSNQSDSVLYLGHRGLREMRSPSRQFFPRVENKFSRIIRKGSTTKDYTWEITDKNGTKYIYGAAGATLKGLYFRSGLPLVYSSISDSVIAEWKISRIEELHGDFVQFYYNKQKELISGSVKADAIYLEKVESGIRYNNKDSVLTKVVLSNRNFSKSKQLSSGRYGFMTSNTKLLDRVDVYFEKQLLRTYNFDYVNGEFATDLLEKISHKDNEGIVVSSNKMSYYNEVNKNNDVYNTYKSNEIWDVKKSTNVNFNPAVTAALRANNIGDGNGTVLGNSSTIAAGGNLYVGFGVSFGAALSNLNTIGANVGKSWGWTDGKATFTDLNGDGLPDYVYIDNNKMYFRPQIRNDYNSTPQFGNDYEISGINEFSKLSSSTTTYGGEFKTTILGFGLDYSSTYTKTSVYFADVNNDGLIDIVNNGKVYFNVITVNSNGIGIPSFTQHSAETANPLSNDRNFDADSFATPPTAVTNEYNEMLEASPYQDIVKVWEAPRTGFVTISGNVRLLTPSSGYDVGAYEKADGVRVAIQKGSGEVWSYNIIKGENNLKTYNSLQFVNKGERIYFRTQSGTTKEGDGNYDVVVWKPKIEYKTNLLEVIGLVKADTTKYLDPNGYSDNIYTPSEGRIVTKYGINRIDTIIPKVKISGHLYKPNTTDDITLHVYLSNDSLLAPNTEPGVIDTVPHVNPNFVSRQEVFTKTISKDDVIDEELEFEIDNSVYQVKDFRFEISSTSNVRWENIKWTPKIHYPTKQGVDTIHGAGVKYCIFSNIVQEGVSNFKANGNRLLILPSSTLDKGNYLLVAKIGNSIQKKYIDLSKPEICEFEVVPNSLVYIELYDLFGKSKMLNKDLEFIKYKVTCYNYNEKSNLSRSLAIIYLNTLGVIVNGNTRFNVLSQPTINDFGPMWRGWGQFEYNTAGGLYSKPIDQTKLSFPRTVPKDTSEVSFRKLNFFPLVPDLETKTYWRGLNENLIIKGDTVATNRLNTGAMISAVDWASPSSINRVKRMSDDGPMKSIAANKQESNFDIISNAPILEIHSTSTCTFGNATLPINIPGLKASAGMSASTGGSETLMNYIDMNGDGIPDVIRNDNTTKNPVRRIEYSNARGWVDDDVCNVDFVNKTNCSSINAGIGGGMAIHATSPTTSSGSASANSNNSTSSTPTNQSSNNAQRTETSSKISQSNTSIAPSLNGSLNFDDLGATYMDVNGDGLPDKVFTENNFIFNNNVIVQLNLGYSFSDKMDWDMDRIQGGTSVTGSIGLGVNLWRGSFQAGFGVSSTTSQVAYTLVDVNGDGLLDKVWLQNITDVGGKGLKIGEIQNYINVSLNVGNGFAPIIKWNTSKISENISTSQSLNAAGTFNFILFAVKFSTTVGAYASTTSSKPTFEMRDVDGDGYTDLLEAGSTNTTLNVRRSTIGRTGKLVSVENSLGGKFTLDYERSKPTSEHPCGKWVMSSLTIDDGINFDGPSIKNAYDYSNGKYDRCERTFLGFKDIAIKEMSENNSVYRTTEKHFNMDNIYLKGLLESVEVKDASNTAQAKTINKYCYYLTNLKFGSKKYKFRSLRPGTGFIGSYSSYNPILAEENYLNGEKTSTAAYDYYTNATDEPLGYGEIKKFRYQEASMLAANYEVTYKYYNNPCFGKGLSLPSELIVRNNAGTNPITYRRIRAYYKDVYNPTCISKLTTFRSPSDSSETNLNYDIYGNLIKKELQSGMAYYYSYDSKYQMYPYQITDKHGYKSTFMNYNYKYGVAGTIIDINGNVKSTILDKIGRPSIITAPKEIAEGKPYTIKFDYYARTIDSDGKTYPAYAVTKHIDVTHPVVDTDIETVSFCDGFGRIVQSKKDASVDGVNMAIVSGLEKMDSWGRVVESHYPITCNTSDKYKLQEVFATNDITKYAYDINNRLTLIELPNNSKTENEYMVNAIGLIIKTTTDALGNITETTQSVGGKLINNVQYYNKKKNKLVTAFEYDDIGQLKKVTDPAGQFTTYTYDSVGHQTEVTHPASGTTRYHYDKTGNMVSKVTANKDSILYGYNFNRLETITYPRHPENNVKYVFGASTDASGFNRKGRLAYQEDGSGTQEFKYGRMGELEENIRTLVIPNQATATYTTKWKYDSWDRLMSMTYPDGEKLTYGYNTGGQLTSIIGASPYLTDVQYDKFEQRTSMTYGNGALTTYTYDPLTRNLSSLNVIANKQYLINNVYAYDKVNNIKTITGTKLNHTYGYDDLYRLTTASGTYGDMNKKGAVYSMSMQYDQLYNPSHKTLNVSQTGMQGEGTIYSGYDLTYAMAANHQQIANIVNTSYRDTQEWSTPPPTHTMVTSTKTYTYDSNGNMLTYNTTGTDAAGNVNRRMLWDEENHLLALSDNGYVSTYWYDGAGERTVKQSGDALSMAVNGTLSGASTGTTNFTAYISPYLVVNNGGLYTKHMYVGSQRIMSKLASSDIFSVNPTDASVSKATYTGNTLNFATKYNTLTATVKARYDSLGVVYNGTPQSSANLITATSAKISTPQQYFYHSDHLGSANYITDSNGDVSQHLEFIASGEVFVDERFKNWHTPFAFNGKEQDEETGLSYFGARYYDPKTNVWYGVDPLAHKYPNVSSYVYCMGNPVNRIDPDGRADFCLNGKVIGNDGVNNQKIYAIKTTEKSFGEGESQIAGAGLSKKDQKLTVDFIKSNSGNADAFQNNGIAYSNSIEIESSSENRQAMVNEVSRDNGNGGTNAANNREYGGSIENGKVVIATPGAVSNPASPDNASIKLPSGVSTFHSHPSGTKTESVEGGTRNSWFNQHPSRTDITNSSSKTEYVFGRGDGKVYIYNKNGVQAVIPMKNFVTPKK